MLQFLPLLSDFDDLAHEAVVFLRRHRFLLVLLVVILLLLLRLLLPIRFLLFLLCLSIVLGWLRPLFLSLKCAEGDQVDANAADSNDEAVVDAEFEEVDADDEKKSKSK